MIIILCLMETSFSSKSPSSNLFIAYHVFIFFIRCELLTEDGVKKLATEIGKRSSSLEDLYLSFER